MISTHGPSKALKQKKFWRGHPAKAFTIHVKFEGEWAKYELLTQHQQTLILAAGRMGSKKAAKAFMRKIKEKITNNQTGFKNSQSYNDAKGRAGGDTRPFMFTGSYLNAISLLHTRRGGFAVGIPKNLKKSSKPRGFTNRMPIDQYAAVLEKGSISSNIWPPRPLWRNTFHEWGGKKKIAAYVGTAMATEYKLIIGR